MRKVAKYPFSSEFCHTHRFDLLSYPFPYISPRFSLITAYCSNESIRQLYGESQDAKMELNFPKSRRIVPAFYENRLFVLLMIVYGWL